MTEITLKTSIDEKLVKEVFDLLGKEALFAESRALKIVARKGRTGWVRKMSTRLGIPQKPLRSRSGFFGKKIKSGKVAQARAKIWVGMKRKITARDTPKVLSKAKGQTFTATMRSGHRGTFTKQDNWITGPRNNYQRVSKNRFVRRDGQWTHLPIDEPSISLARTPFTDDVLISETKGAMNGAYDQELKKELLRRVEKIFRKTQARSKRVR